MTGRAAHRPTGLPVFHSDPAMAVPDDAATDVDLSGIWHSRYEYFSSGQGQHLESEHYIVLRQDENRLAGESVPAVNGSVIRLDLIVDGQIVTGSWVEKTSETGHYRGSVYHGAVQLVVDPAGRSMAGRWVGYNRKLAVNSDVWELRRVASANAATEIRDYYHRV